MSDNKMRFSLLTVLFTLLFFAASSERATITLLQPRMIDTSSNTKGLCVVKDNTASPKQVDNCPGGSICVETTSLTISNKPIKHGRCTLFTLALHQGASAFDHEATTELKIETGIDSNGNELSCDRTVTNPTTHQKWRCLEIGVHLLDIVTSEYDPSCTVEYKGVMGENMGNGTNGKLGATVHDRDGGNDQSATDISGKNYKVVSSQSDALSCYFIPQNRLYLGSSYAQITFTKTSNLGLGEKAKKIVKLPLRHVPGNPVVAGATGTAVSAADPAVNGAHSLISSLANEGLMYNDSASVSDGGTMKVKYKFIVQDKRYKTKDQSGIEALPQTLGPFQVIKEGLEIHADYQNFYDATENEFANTNVYATPLSQTKRISSTTQCALKGTSGGSSACTNSDLIYDDKSQFQLEGVYEAKYGGLPHWKKGYIGCQLCDNKLAIKAFENSGVPQLDASFDVDVTQLRSGCTSGSCIYLQNIFADEVNSGVGHEDLKAVRLPNCKSDGSKCGSAGGFDPQHENGHVLGEFLKPKVIGTNGVSGSGATGYLDLDAQFDFLGSSRLIVTDDTKKITNTAVGNSGLAIHGDCASKGSGAVYTMSNDMLSAANQLFYTDCKIKVYKTAYGKVSTIAYFKSSAARQTCLTTQGAGNCTNAVYAQIIENDNRVIKIGNTELSLLRRKLASVDKSGAAITMSVSKQTGDSTILYFEVKGSDTMVGYNSDGTAKSSLKDSERYFQTDSLDNAIIRHTVRSSPACTGFMDIQIHDRNNSFAKFDVRLPCSRTTASATDNIKLSFDFTLGYDLVTNKLSAEAIYLSDMASNNVTGYMNDTLFDSGLQQNLEVSAAFGTCSADNQFVKKGDSSADWTDNNGDFKNCAQSSSANGAFSVDTGTTRFENKNAMDLPSWKNCSYSVQDDSSNNNYIVTTNLALRYKRTLYYTSNTGSTFSVNYFCADRTFTTTLRRDASASVSVATLQAPELQRAVSVTDISWESCTQSNGAAGYELHIDITNKQKDVTATTWTTENTLTNVLKQTSSEAVDSDNLQIVKGTKMINSQKTTMGEGEAANSNFTLKSACVVITQADCDAITAPQTSATASTGSEYAKLTHTKTDLVLRGDFQGGAAVDSDVQIVTRYLECPVDEANEASGYVRAGAQLVCDAAIQNASSPTVESQNDCTKAYTTDKGTAIAKLYLSNNDASSSSKLTSSEHTKAVNAGWIPRHVQIFIERYEKDFLSTTGTGTLLSTDKFCECGAADTQFNAATQCKKHSSSNVNGLNLKDRITQLTPFSTIVCGGGSANAYTYDRLKVDFTPLADATNDLFVVRFEILSENTNLNTRRLRRSTIRYTLGATSSATASSSALAIVPASTQQGDGPAVEELPALPAPSQPAPVAPEEPAAPAAAESDSEELSTGAIVGIVAGSVVGLLLIIWGIMWAMRGCSTSDIPLFAPASSEFSGAAVGFSDSGRQRRFNNLRY